jgi:hypothetical protein
MWKRNRVLLLFLTFASLLLSPRCATIIGKSTQRIPVTSSPAGAVIIVNGVEQGATPIEIRLLRKTKGQVIRIESPGYDPLEIRPERRMASISAVGNILLGLACAFPIVRRSGIDTAEMGSFWLRIVLGTAGFAGLFEVLDLSSKKGYEFRPADIYVPLKKAEGTPRVDTMFIDADDLPNIRWIRIRKD